MAVGEGREGAGEWGMMGMADYRMCGSELEKLCWSFLLSVSPNGDGTTKCKIVCNWGDAFCVNSYR